MNEATDTAEELSLKSTTKASMINTFFLSCI